VLLLDDRLVALANQQDGLLTHGQLLSAGWSRDVIKSRSREWRRVVRGVYSIDGRELTEDVFGTAAALCWPAAALSHETAARRRGWKLLNQTPDWGPWLDREPETKPVVHLTSAKQCRVPEAFRLHRADPGDCYLVRGARVTDEVRTLVDIARTAPLPVAVCAIDSICHQDQALFDAVGGEIARISGHRGAHRAQRARGLAHPGSESILETLLRLLIVFAGLPQPQVQLPVRHPGGTYYGDLGYRDRRLILEADGRDYHSDWRKVMDDMARQNVLVGAGWTILRFSWRQVLYQPDMVIRAVAAALGL
jgi:very-short-patch-repair endonuclease